MGKRWRIVGNGGEWVINCGKMDDKLWKIRKNTYKMMKNMKEKCNKREKLWKKHESLKKQPYAI